MSRILAIVNDRNHVDRVLFELRKSARKNNVGIVAIGFQSFDTDVPFRGFAEYVSPLYEEIAARKARSWIKEWTNKKIFENKTFKEIISYEGVSLWWFVEFHYFYALYISQIARYIEILKAITAKEKPEKLVYVRDGSLLCRVLDVFAEANNIDTSEISQIPDAKGSIENRFTSFLRSYARRRWKALLTIKEHLRSVWTRALNLFLTRKLTKTDQLPSVIIISPERFWLSITDPETGKTRKGFVLTDSVIKKLAERNRVLLVSVDPFFNKLLGLKILLEEKLTYPNVIIKTPENWENKSVKHKVTGFKKKLDATWKILSDSKDFQSSLNYEGIPLWRVLQETFSGIFMMELPEAVRWIETMKVMIDKEKPSALVLPGEYCSFLGSAAIIAGKKKRIPTIAIQHGVITKNSLEYAMTPNEKKEDANSKLWVIPTKLAVYGEYTKHTLEALQYPAEVIAVTGHPDYDVLFKMERLVDKREILKELGIKYGENRIITFTTQPLWSIKSRENLLRTVLETVKKLPDATLLIKPHPGENEDWHKKIVKETAVRNAIVLKRDYNTAKALLICDLMITAYSTTAMEAMALNKLAITINLEDESEIFPYAQSGAAIGVFSPEDLLPTIEDVFENEKLRKKLAERRQKFLSEHIYKTDGHSSERIVNLISQIVQERSATPKNLIEACHD